MVVFVGWIRKDTIFITDWGMVDNVDVLYWGNLDIRPEAGPLWSDTPRVRSNRTKASQGQSWPAISRTSGVPVSTLHGASGRRNRRRRGR
jgi:hypothetical protein